MTHKTKRPVLLGIILIIIGVCIFAPTIWSQPLHSIMLSVPDHAEEALTWCGPATGQMIMEGYPSGSCSLLQEDIWMAIQSYKTETMWDTDPVGLREAMKHLCPPAGTWVVHKEANPQVLMHSIGYWMTNNSYPAAALLDTEPHNSYTAHAEHWVAIRGIVTDKDPITNTTVNLEFIWFNDPCPANMGDPSIERYVSGSTWYSEFASVTKAGSSYNGKYVAIIEPPRIRGKAIAPSEVVTGRIISPTAALQFAARWIEQYKLDKIKPYTILKESRPLEPLLVNKIRGGYYIIPYASEENRGLARVAIIINAYNGKFQEIGAFKPVQYLPEQKAKELALKKLRVERPRSIKTELVFEKRKDVNRYFPTWQVDVDGKKVGVNINE